MIDRPRQPKTAPKLPSIRKNVVRPTGPRALRIVEQYIGGYGEPPPGFVRGQTSITEWICYWGLFKIGDPRADPRQPPFFGLPGFFEYQSAQMGGYVRALGSAVVDFLVHLGQRMVAIRVQTEFFHQFTDNRKQAQDRIQRANLMRNLDVIDIYDQDLLGDPSGAKAIVTLKRALNLIETPDPVLSGEAIRGSRLKVGT